jgi:hypothetical protein
LQSIPRTADISPNTFLSDRRSREIVLTRYTITRAAEKFCRIRSRSRASEQF